MHVLDYLVGSLFRGSDLQRHARTPAPPAAEADANPWSRPRPAAITPPTPLTPRLPAHLQLNPPSAHRVATAPAVQLSTAQAEGVAAGTSSPPLPQGSAGADAAVPVDGFAASELPVSSEGGAASAAAAAALQEARVAAPAAASPGPAGLKDCHTRACLGVVSAFQRALRTEEGAAAGSARQHGAPAIASTSGGSSGSSSSSGSAGGDAGEQGHARQAAGHSGAHALPAQPAADGDAGVDGSGRPECPPDTWELGRASWTFLHSVGAHYPDRPSARQQELMRGMMEALAEFYPCQVCAEHLREQVRANPPRVATAQELNLWLCGIHNEVNELLGKPLFDCSRIAARWREGPKDGSCD